MLILPDTLAKLHKAAASQEQVTRTYTDKAGFIVTYRGPVDVAPPAADFVAGGYPVQPVVEPQWHEWIAQSVHGMFDIAPVDFSKVEERPHQYYRTFIEQYLNKPPPVDMQLIRRDEECTSQGRTIITEHLVESRFMSQPFTSPPEVTPDGVLVDWELRRNDLGILVLCQRRVEKWL